MRRLSVLTAIALALAMVGWYAVSTRASPTDGPFIPSDALVPAPQAMGYRGTGAAPVSVVPQPAVPHGRIWEMRWDLVLDGRLEGGTTRLFRFDIANDQIRARFAGEDKQYNEPERFWHGEIITGRNPIITFRRDDACSYGAAHILHQVRPGHFRGTWVDNNGSAGDITLTLHAADRDWQSGRCPARSPSGAPDKHR